MIILAFLSKNTVQRPKTLFLCLLYIQTFPIASFLIIQFNGLIQVPKTSCNWPIPDTKIFEQKLGVVPWISIYTFIHPPHSYILKATTPHPINHGLQLFFNQKIVTESKNKIYKVTLTNTHLRRAILCLLKNRYINVQVAIQLI